MTTEDIIRMAQEAGLFEVPYPNPSNMKEVERFTALVAAVEREACAKVCDDLWKVNAAASECAAAIRERNKE